MAEFLEVSNQELISATPLVSVLMLAYNHQDYISQAIESIVAQQCNFEFELIIGEDASTDDTLMIIFNYQKKYPGIIRVVYAENNVGMNANSKRILGVARGKYLAYCEGDDYWCYKNKLQKQVELIEQDAEVAAVHTDWVRSRKLHGSWVVDWSSYIHKRINPKLLSGDLFAFFYVPKIMRTCTLMIRKEFADNVEQSILRSKNYKFGDTIYTAFITSQAKVAYLPEITAVYRLSPNSALRSGIRSRIDFLLSSLEFDSAARKYFGPRSDYPMEYRWELCIGIILWSIRICDFQSIKMAISDLKANFTIFEFFIAGWRSLLIRLPVRIPNERRLS